MMSKSFLIVSSLGALLAGGAGAKTKCPDAIKSAVQRDYPDGKVSSCKQASEAGKSFYEVKVKTSDAKKLKVDVDQDGKMLQAERTIKKDEIPAGVRSAFETKYGKAKIKSAERQTKPDGSITYELGFRDNGKKHFATFKEDGAFVEQE
jgi:hypothetical protein